MQRMLLLRLLGGRAPFKLVNQDGHVKMSSFLEEYDMSEQSITINGNTYAVSELSDAAKAQVANIQVVDAELAKLQQQVAIFQTARQAYIQALVAAVEVEATPKTTVRKTRTKKA